MIGEGVPREPEARIPVPEREIRRCRLPGGHPRLAVGIRILQDVQIAPRVFHDRSRSIPQPEVHAQLAVELPLIFEIKAVNPVAVVSMRIGLWIHRQGRLSYRRSRDTLQEACDVREHPHAAVTNWGL